MNDSNNLSPEIELWLKHFQNSGIQTNLGVGTNNIFYADGMSTTKELQALSEKVRYLRYDCIISWFFTMAILLPLIWKTRNLK